MPLRRWFLYGFALCAHYSGLDLLYRRMAGAGLVVLMLHRLRDEHDPYPLSMSPASLRRVIEWLRAGNVLVGLDEGLDALARPKAPVLGYAITFDDGYRDNLGLIDGHLDPVPAVVYIVTDHIGRDPIWVYRLTNAVESRTRDYLDLGELGLGSFDLADAGERERLYQLLPPRLKQLPPDQLQAHIDAVVVQVGAAPATPDHCDMLGWDDVRRLIAGGVQIGGHTCRHALLSRVDEATAREEIVGSHARITDELGVQPMHFAYPNGGPDDFSERDVLLAKEAGFRTAATSIEGINRRGVDPYRLMRHNVYDARYRAPSGRLSKALFFSETSGLLGWLRSLRAA